MWLCLCLFRPSPKESVWSGLTAPVSFDTQLLQRRFALADVARCGTGRSVPGAKGHAGQGRSNGRVLGEAKSEADYKRRNSAKSGIGMNLTAISGLGWRPIGAFSANMSP